jgi:Kef-type K+ transport system membrane component KefB
MLSFALALGLSLYALVSGPGAANAQDPVAAVDAGVAAPVVVPVPGGAGVDAGVPGPEVAPDAAVAPVAPVAPVASDAGGVPASVDAETVPAPLDAGAGGAMPDASDAGHASDAGGPAPLTTAPTPAAVLDAGAPGPDAGAATEPAEIDAPAGPANPTRGAWIVVKLVIGLTALFVLAYLGSHKKVVRWQERLGIGGVIAAGFPFIALGVIVSQPEVGVLTPEVLHKFQPILFFALGWLGFIIGAQLDVRLLDRVPKGTAYLIVVEALAPFAATAAACGGAMVVLGGASFADDTLWRDLIVLGTAAAMTAPRRFRGFANRTWKEGRSVDHLLGQLDEIVGVVGLLFVAAYFRPSVEVGWQLPGTAWVFVSIGLGVVIGVLIFAMVRVPVSNAEFLAVVLGSIAFGAGLAGYLFLSPLVVCFIAGALVTNFPCDQRDSIFRILNHLERPIHLLFLIVAGATWHVFDWRAWAIVPLFVVARIVGKWIGIFTASRTVGDKLPTGYADQRALVTPLSALSIALVVNSQGLGGELTSWITTVVIGAAILNEILVSITAPPRPAARAATELPALGPNSGVFPRVPPGAAEAPAGAAVIDELDHEESSRTEVRDRDAGPVYRDPDVDTDVGTDVGTDRGDKRGGR